MFHDYYVDSKAAISGIDCFLVVNGKNCPSINFMKSHKIYSNIHFPLKNKFGGKKNVCHGSLMPWRLPSSS